MASLTNEPASTGVVALDSSLRTLGIIIADRATDIPYSADALNRLVKLLRRSSKTFDVMNKDEACALYHSVADDMNRLRDKYEIYHTILQEKDKVTVNHKKGSQKLLKVQQNIDRLLVLMMEQEQQQEEETLPQC
ncbi:hypothetical protein QBC32DRAFT_318310 [Pseudoneurospora amorphoporcata]|uniref:Uncharacterized protein n=1 Tax=Pseudoneurospora amorphoporcata TaxID=241081 RepID=A0AAN6NLB1_9PEZI|nr:hypothetical protein QBC32DRAFT_318310 [Pseudoneurospora amorphoporcata]